MAAVSLVQVERVNQLQRATHIKWLRGPSYFHHAIVEEVYPEEDTIKIIHYAPDEGTEEKLKGIIHELQLDPFAGKQPLFMVRYNNDDECYSDDDVIERAHSRIGEKAYNLLTNNCEHFATWCKTGKKSSCQVKSVGTIAAKQIGFSAIRGGFRVLTGIIRYIIDDMALTVAQALKNVFTGGLVSAKKISALGKVGSYAAIALIVIAEGAITMKDIYDLHKRKIKGDLNDKEFTNQTVIRSSEGICTVVGAVLGAFAGAFIPVPFLGEILGSFIGGLIGKGIGRLCGKGMVEFVDLVRHELKAIPNWQDYTESALMLQSPN